MPQIWLCRQEEHGSTANASAEEGRHEHLQMPKTKKIEDSRGKKMMEYSLAESWRRSRIITCGDHHVIIWSRENHHP